MHVVEVAYRQSCPPHCLVPRLYPYSYYFSSKKGVDCSSLDYPFPQVSR